MNKHTDHQLLPDGEHLLFTIAKQLDAARWDQAQIVVQNLKSGERKTVINGGSDGRYLPSGHLLYAVGGVMLAVPFDLRRLQPTGSAVPVLEGVARARGAGSGQAHVAVAPSGAVLYVPGPVSPPTNARQLAIANRTGVVKALTMPVGPYVHVRTSAATANMWRWEATMARKQSSGFTSSQARALFDG